MVKVHTGFATVSHAQTSGKLVGMAHAVIYIQRLADQRFARLMLGVAFDGCNVERCAHPVLQG